MPHRYFTTDINGDTARIIGEEAHHLANVMRAKRGQSITLCDCEGFDYEAQVQSIDRELVVLDITSKKQSVSEATIAVTLYIGYPKADKLEWILQKGTELGAVRFVPFFSKLCVAAPKNEQAKNERYNKIVLQAAKQSGRGIIPQVDMPISFDEMLCNSKKNEASLFCYEGGGESIHSRLNGVKTVCVITGSEGGFTLDEAQRAKIAGCTQIGLGPRILRCETAPIAALCSVMTLSGNLQ